MAQLVKPATPAFHSGHDLTVCEIQPLGFAPRAHGLLGTLSLPLSLSLSENKQTLKIKQNLTGTQSMSQTKTRRSAGLWAPKQEKAAGSKSQGGTVYKSSREAGSVARLLA